MYAADRPIGQERLQAKGVGPGEELELTSRRARGAGDGSREQGELTDRLELERVWHVVPRGVGDANGLHARGSDALAGARREEAREVRVASHQRRKDERDPR